MEECQRMAHGHKRSPTGRLESKAFLFEKKWFPFGALMTAPIIGCGNEPTPEPEYTSDGTTSGSACAVAFQLAFIATQIVRLEQSTLL